MSRADHRAGPARLLSLSMAALMLLLAACSSRDAELDRFIEATKKEPGGQVDPLPEVKLNEPFTYADKDLRSPFVPGGSGGENSSGPRPDRGRSHEYLEQFALDSMKMVGTLTIGNNHYGLVAAKDGRVHRVVVGDHLGQNDGRITSIEPSKISLVEVAPDGLGGYIERQAALSLNE